MEQEQPSQEAGSIDSDSDYDSSDENPFDENEILCVGIDSAFCNLAFQVNQMLYSNLIYKGDEQKDASQDVGRLKTYEESLDSIHSLLYGLFTQQNSPEDPIPEEIEEKIPEELRETVRNLYKESCNAYTNNNDPNTRDIYRIFIHNIYHVYPYEMSRSDVDENE